MVVILHVIDILLFLPRPAQNHREKLCEILHSHKTQYAIIALVVTDMIIVIAELLLDLRAIEGESHAVPISFPKLFSLLSLPTSAY